MLRQFFTGSSEKGSEKEGDHVGQQRSAERLARDAAELLPPAPFFQCWYIIYLVWMFVLVLAQGVDLNILLNSSSPLSPIPVKTYVASVF